jgi:hypothetical protein
MELTMASLLKIANVERVPFVWFWPNGAPGCAMMTHDVESPAGLDFCDQLMDLDSAFGIKSAFQLVPEMPHGSTEALWARLRSRGFEVNLHDLSHDGSLFQSELHFRRRATEINRYALEFQCAGFRSGAMYRQQEWFDALEFSYDMSVPNVAHLEPQRGGCCTVMPYFVGGLLELPLTTTQDYSLFHIVGDYSIALWTQQVEMILARNGLGSFITHPDYLFDDRAGRVYSELLAYVAELRARRGVWVALPSEVNDWWRCRDAMTLVRDGLSWRIDGPESRRARLAYASLSEDNRVVYTLDDRQGATP